MHIPRALLALSLLGTLSACVVVPVESPPAPNTCNTYTRSMSLQTVELNAGCSGSRADACVVAALAVSAGSVIISGSIVLTNNTVHWLEYQGSCSDSFLQSATRHFVDSFSNPKLPSEAPQQH